MSTPSLSHHPDNHEGSSPPPPPPVFQQPPPVSSAAAAFIAAAAAAAAASGASPPSDLENNHHPHLHLNHPLDRPRLKSRRGRGGSRSARSERMSAALGTGSPRSLSEMSVRGLDLLRYATLAPDGTYRLRQLHSITFGFTFGLVLSNVIPFFCKVQLKYLVKFT